MLTLQYLKRSYNLESHWATGFMLTAVQTDGISQANDFIKRSTIINTKNPHLMVLRLLIKYYANTPVS